MVDRAAHAADRAKRLARARDHMWAKLGRAIDEGDADRATVVEDDSTLYAFCEDSAGVWVAVAHPDTSQPEARAIYLPPGVLPALIDAAQRVLELRDCEAPR